MGGFLKGAKKGVGSFGKGVGKGVSSSYTYLTGICLILKFCMIFRLWAFNPKMRQRDSLHMVKNFVPKNRMENFTKQKT